MTDNIQFYILNGLLSIEDYTAKYIDKISPTHFSIEMQPIIKGIQLFYLKYLKIPSIDMLIDKILPKILKDNQDAIEKCEEIIHSSMTIQFKQSDFYDWLKEETNAYIKKQRVMEAMVQLHPLIQEGKLEDAKKILDEAYQINFDDNLGLDYFGHIDERIKRLKDGTHIIPTGIEALDNKLNGGWRNKSLIVFGAGTNVGKTLILSDLALKLIKQGLDGLYITLEIYEDSLANRIDANLTNVRLSDLQTNADYLLHKIKEEKEKAENDGTPFGKFFIKEFPPGINCNAIMSLLREMRLKQGFVPKFIMLDYIGLMSPNGKTVDHSFTDLKKVSEQIRSLAAMMNIPIFTAQQTNRDSYGLSEIGLESTSESMGIPFTADVMIMCSRTKDMEEENQMYWYIAKSRFSKNNDGLFVNVEYDFMRISESEYTPPPKEKPKPKSPPSVIKISSHTQNVSGDEMVPEWSKRIK
jgi:hypothetical protein